MFRRYLGIILCSALWLTPRRSAAQEIVLEAHPAVDVVPVAPVARRFAFEAAAVFGFVGAPIYGATNPFGGGFGGRLGVDLWNVYLGASLTDFLGGSDNGATDRALLVGVDVGYSFRIGRYFALRPVLGVGDTILSHTEPGTSGTSTPDVVTSASGISSSSGSTTTGGTPAETTTVSNIYVRPELNAIFSYGHVFAGIGFGTLIIPNIVYGPSPATATTWLSYSFETQVGFRL